MFSRGALAAFALILVEFLVFGLAIRAVGLLFVVLAWLAGAVLGSAIVRRQVPQLLDSGRNIMSTLGLGPDGVDTSATSDRAVLTGAGLLLIFPGLVTGIIGLALLLPPIRALVRGVVGTKVARFVPSGLAMPFAMNGDAFQRRGSSRADVVDVDVVSEDMPQPAPPELD